MPELICDHCGALVKVRGLAAVCPNCKELVTPPPASMMEGSSAAMQSVEPVPQELHPRAPLAPADHDAPPPIASAADGPFMSTWKIVGITLAALLGIGLIVDNIRLRLRPPSVVTVVPPNPSPRVDKPRPTTRTAQQDRPSIFEESHQPSAPLRTPHSARPSKPATGPQTDSGMPRMEPTPPPVPPAKPAHPYAYLATFKPVKQTGKSNRVTDEQIGEAIQRGVDFLLDQFTQTRLKGADNYDAETFGGLNALCVYALLHAGQAISDERLSAQNDLMKSLIARVKEFPMDGSRATYSRSLRIAALAVQNRPEDRAAIEKDVQWLVSSSIQGAYTYSKPASDAQRSGGGWDNSNSQYGVLGIWAATEAGFRIPSQYWSDVEAHWIESQTHSGGWGYGPGAQSATLAMTSAGVTSLFIAREQLGTIQSTAPDAPLLRSIQRGLEWLDEGDNSIKVDQGHKGYTLYGLERAGLASGYKFFGKHDWYLDLAAKAIAEQRPDGSWDGGDGTLAETAFTLLFLSRGRHPIFVSKLRLDSSRWGRPRDIANLTRFAGRELERPLNWQTVGMERDWTEWTDAPVLFISSDRELEFSDNDVRKLRAYVESGGMVFTHADKSSEAFNHSVEMLAKRLFAEHPITPLPDDHFVYSVMFRSENKPPLRGISNGNRMLLVHSPTDLGRAWTVRPIRSNRPSLETAVNVIVYAAGRREFRNRVNSTYVAPPSESSLATIPVARLRYEGNWDPEPGAWPRFARVLQKQTSLGIAVLPIDVADLKYETAPVAHLTGIAAYKPTESQIDALRQYIARGGVLLIDACGGSKAFHDGIQQQLLPKLFPASTPQPLEPAHPLLAGASDGMQDLTRARFRLYAVETRGRVPGEIVHFAAGNGHVIISELDLTSGLLGTSTWGIAGFEPAYAEGFVSNLLLWTLDRIQRQIR